MSLALKSSYRDIEVVLNRLESMYLRASFDYGHCAFARKVWESFSLRKIWLEVRILQVKWDRYFCMFNLLL